MLLGIDILHDKEIKHLLFFDILSWVGCHTIYKLRYGQWSYITADMRQDNKDLLSLKFITVNLLVSVDEKELETRSEVQQIRCERDHVFFHNVLKSRKLLEILFSNALSNLIHRKSFHFCSFLTCKCWFVSMFYYFESSKLVNLNKLSFSLVLIWLLAFTK